MAGYPGNFKRVINSAHDPFTLKDAPRFSKLGAWPTCSARARGELGPAGGGLLRVGARRKPVADVHTVPASCPPHRRSAVRANGCKID